MAMNMRISSLIPAGLVVESITETEAEIVVLARAAEPERLCPLCGVHSRRIHSRYLRTVSDLPVPAVGLNFALWPGVSFAMRHSAGGRSLPSALAMALWQSAHDGRRDWSVSCTISGWRLEDGRRQAWPGG